MVWRRVLQEGDNVCVGGCGSAETAVHLVLGCNLFGGLWYLIRWWLGISMVDSRVLRDHFLQFGQFPSLSRSSHSFLRLHWLASVWTIWKERNNRVFENTTSDLHVF
jgi:hypothetical protein